MLLLRLVWFSTQSLWTPRLHPNIEGPWNCCGRLCQTSSDLSLKQDRARHGSQDCRGSEIRDRCVCIVNNLYRLRQPLRAWIGSCRASSKTIVRLTRAGAKLLSWSKQCWREFIVALNQFPAMTLNPAFRMLLSRFVMHLYSANSVAQASAKPAGKRKAWTLGASKTVHKKHKNSRHGHVYSWFVFAGSQHTSWTCLHSCNWLLTLQPVQPDLAEASWPRGRSEAPAFV